MPLVVTPGVPILTPEAIAGGWERLDLT